MSRLKTQICLLCSLNYFIVFLFSFLIVDLYFLIVEIIANIFNHIVEIIISFDISIKEAKPEIEIHTVSVKNKLRKCSISFKVVQTFLFLLLNNSCWSIFFNKVIVYLFYFFQNNGRLISSSVVFIK